MDKVLVELFVPILDEKYDVFITHQCSVKELIELLKSILYTESKNLYFQDSNLVLYFVDGDENLDFNIDSVYSKIKNGSRIMLI